MNQLEVEDDVYDALRENAGLTIDQLIETTGHKRQDVRRALKILLRQKPGAYMMGVENRQRVFSAR